MHYTSGIGGLSISGGTAWAASDQLFGAAQIMVQAAGALFGLYVLTFVAAVVLGGYRNASHAPDAAVAVSSVVALDDLFPSHQTIRPWVRG